MSCVALVLRVNDDTARLPHGVLSITPRLVAADAKNGSATLCSWEKGTYVAVTHTDCVPSPFLTALSQPHWTLVLFPS